MNAKKSFQLLALCGGFLTMAGPASQSYADAPRVPEPQPVRGPIEVHAFYYPGMSRVFPGGHRMNTEVVTHTLLPFIRELNVI